MYYYIVDLPPRENLVKLQNNLRQTFANLGITGEMALASPARSAEEIAQMGLSKGYTTIVAIGDDDLVNRLVSLVARTQAALGVIPVGLSAELCAVFGVNGLKDACETLKRRKIKAIDLGYVHPEKFFLNAINIYPEEPLPVSLDIDNNCRVEAIVDSMQISRDLEINFSVYKEETKQGWLSRFAKSSSQSNISRLHAHKISIFTPQPNPIYIGEQIIAKTPAEISRLDKVLKIITGYDTI